jgi:ribonucleoside-triphosphate reductase
MIARKAVEVSATGIYRGKHNFWSKARRLDWATRKRIKEDDMNNVIQ